MVKRKAEEGATSSSSATLKKAKSKGTAGKKGKKEEDEDLVALQLKKEKKEHERVVRLAYERGLFTEEETAEEDGVDFPDELHELNRASIVNKPPVRGKQRFVFVLPCRLGSLSDKAEIGKLCHIDSRNPVLYINLPNGRIKLLGTITHPTTSYLQLNAKNAPKKAGKKGGKVLEARGTFESLVVFSDYHWIGTEEENPSESPLLWPLDVNAEADSTPSPLPTSVASIHPTDPEPSPTTSASGASDMDDVIEIL